MRIFSSSLKNIKKQNRLQSSRDSKLRRLSSLMSSISRNGSYSSDVDTGYFGEMIYNANTFGYSPATTYYPLQNIDHNNNTIRSSLQATDLNRSGSITRPFTSIGIIDEFDESLENDYREPKTSVRSKDRSAHASPTQKTTSTDLTDIARNDQSPKNLSINSSSSSNDDGNHSIYFNKSSKFSGIDNNFAVLPVGSISLKSSAKSESENENKLYQSKEGVSLDKLQLSSSLNLPPLTISPSFKEHDTIQVNYTYPNGSRRWTGGVIVSYTIKSSPRYPQTLYPQNSSDKVLSQQTTPKSNNISGKAEGGIVLYTVKFDDGEIKSNITEDEIRFSKSKSRRLKTNLSNRRNDESQTAEWISSKSSNNSLKSKSSDLKLHELQGDSQSEKAVKSSIQDYNSDEIIPLDYGISAHSPKPTSRVLNMIEPKTNALFIAIPKINSDTINPSQVNGTSENKLSSDDFLKVCELDDSAFGDYDNSSIKISEDNATSLNQESALENASEKEFCYSDDSDEDMILAIPSVFDGFEKPQVNKNSPVVPKVMLSQIDKRSTSMNAAAASLSNNLLYEQNDDQDATDSIDQEDDDATLCRMKSHDIYYQQNYPNSFGEFEVNTFDSLPSSPSSFLSFNGPFFRSPSTSDSSLQQPITSSQQVETARLSDGIAVLKLQLNRNSSKDFPSRYHTDNTSKNSYYNADSSANVSPLASGRLFSFTVDDFVRVSRPDDFGNPLRNTGNMPAPMKMQLSIKNPISPDSGVDLSAASTGSDKTANDKTSSNIEGTGTGNHNSPKTTVTRSKYPIVSPLYFNQPPSGADSTLQSLNPFNGNSEPVVFEEKYLLYSKSYPLIILFLLQRCFIDKYMIDSSICFERNNSSLNPSNLSPPSSPLATPMVTLQRQLTNQSGLISYPIQKVNLFHTIRDYFSNIVAFSASNQILNNMTRQIIYCITEYATLTNSALLRLLKLLTGVLFQNNCLNKHLSESSSISIGSGGFGSVHRVYCNCGKLNLAEICNLIEYPTHSSNSNSERKRVSAHKSSSTGIQSMNVLRSGSIHRSKLSLAAIAPEPVADEETLRSTFNNLKLSSQSNSFMTCVFFEENSQLHTNNMIYSRKPMTQSGDNFYAIKRIKHEKSVNDEPKIIDIYNEITCLEILSSYRGVCPLYDYGINTECNEYWLVMECGGCNLSEWRKHLTNDDLSIDTIFYHNIHQDSRESHNNTGDFTSLIHFDVFICSCIPCVI